MEALGHGRGEKGEGKRGWTPRGEKGNLEGLGDDLVVVSSVAAAIAAAVDARARQELAERAAHSSSGEGVRGRRRCGRVVLVRASAVTPLPCGESGREEAKFERALLLRGS